MVLFFWHFPAVSELLCCHFLLAHPLPWPRSFHVSYLCVLFLSFIAFSSLPLSLSFPFFFLYFPFFSFSFSFFLSYWRIFRSFPYLGRVLCVWVGFPTQVPPDSYLSSILLSPEIWRNFLELNVSQESRSEASTDIWQSRSSHYSTTLPDHLWRFPYSRRKWNMWYLNFFPLTASLCFASMQLPFQLALLNMNQSRHQCIVCLYWNSSIFIFIFCSSRLPHIWVVHSIGSL